MADKKLDPILSEFESEREANAYDKWFRAKVQAAMDDKRPDVPHDEAMARVSETIRKAAASAKKRA